MSIKKKIKILLITAFFIAVIFCNYSKTSTILINRGVAELDAKASSVIYSALSDELIESSNFENLFNIVLANDNSVSYILTDSFKVNSLAYNLANKTADLYEKFALEGVEIPIGSFSGFSLFSGVGKAIKVRLISVVSVKCEFVSKFETAGINQTRQTLYLNVCPDFQVMWGGKNIKKQMSVSVLVYDNLIVGKVPNSYFSAKVIGFGEFLN